MDMYLQLAGVAVVSVPLLRIAMSAYVAALLGLSSLPKRARLALAMVIYVVFAAIVVAPLFVMLFVARGNASGPLASGIVGLVFCLFGLVTLWPLLVLKRRRPELRAAGYG